jgi:hypothetical protein
METITNKQKTKPKKTTNLKKQQTCKHNKPEKATNKQTKKPKKTTNLKKQQIVCKHNKCKK